MTLHDTLVINVMNQISEPTTLHVHGLFQTANNQMDGPSMVTQCPIPPGANFTYTIPIEQYGTYWIHGHNKGHYVDGLRAPLIIHNPAETYHYDEEYTLAFAGEAIFHFFFLQQSLYIHASILSLPLTPLASLHIYRLVPR